MNERKFDNFDEFAREYRDIHSENIQISGADSAYFSRHKMEVLKEIEPLFAVNRSVKMLDVGCGDGNTAEFVEELANHIQYIGIDISKESIATAQERKLNQSTFIVYDGEKIPFEDNQFDICFVANVYHHLDSAYQLPLTKEMYRVLKPGGRLYVFEHNPWNPITQKIVRDCIFDRDAVLLPKPRLKSIFKSAGFQKVDARFVLFMPRSRFFKSLLFLERYLHKLPIGAQYVLIGQKKL